MKKITLLTICISLLCSANVFAQTTYYVSATGDNTNTGIFDFNAWATVGHAVENTASGDTIIIIDEITQTGAVNIDKSLTFQGQGNAIINGTDNFNGGDSPRLYGITNPSLTISFTDITMQGSKNKSALGSVFLINPDAEGSTLTLTNITFDDNSTASGFQGGTMMIFAGTVDIEESVFKNNTSGRSGGAIYVNSSANPTVNITGTTFYNNLAQGTLGSDGGGAIHSEGGQSGQVTITNCTFYQNKNIKGNLDYPTIRSTNSNVAVTNSLFYENSVDVDGLIFADFGSAPGGTQSFTYSIAQWITNNVDTRNDFISFVKGGADPNDVAADLTSSNLMFNDATGKVEYTLPASGDDSPIGFGSDGNDVGAWNSGLTLSTVENTFLINNFKIFEDQNTNTLNLINRTNQKVNIEIYNLLGSKLLSVKNLGEETQIKNTFQAGVYVLHGETDNGSFSKKFVIRN